MKGYLWKRFQGSRNVLVEIYRNFTDMKPLQNRESQRGRRENRHRCRGCETHTVNSVRPLLLFLKLSVIHIRHLCSCLFTYLYPLTYRRTESSMTLSLYILCFPERVQGGKTIKSVSHDLRFVGKTYKIPSFWVPVNLQKVFDSLDSVADTQSDVLSKKKYMDPMVSR